MALFEITSLCFSCVEDYKAIDIVGDVSFSLEKNRIYDLVDTSGVERLTLLKLLVRMLPRTAGKMYPNGIPSTDFAPTEWRQPPFGARSDWHRSHAHASFDACGGHHADIRDDVWADSLWR